MPLLTVHTAIFLNDRMFRPNEQHEYIDTGTTTTGCGCNRTLKTIKTYKVIINGNTFHLPETNIVETTVPIAPRDQDFQNVLYSEHKQDLEHKDYKDINNNCINCNDLEPHGDLTNNRETPSRYAGI